MIMFVFSGDDELNSSQSEWKRILLCAMALALIYLISIRQKQSAKLFVINSYKRLTFYRIPKRIVIVSSVSLFTIVCLFIIY